MSADRPLAARYTESVFPDKPWSPTVVQALALIEIAKGEQVVGDLAEALINSFPPKVGQATRGVLKPFNEAPPLTRSVLREPVSTIVGFNIVNSPDYVETREAQEARSNLLAIAIAQVGLELISEI